ncbi:hypothetical protein KAFR_0D01300 [Kazachstania africana CBS 2517]|uniref:Nucleotide exchange factor SIL1 n=1 Tax=Kazachstania africana (strain ATCC 22294 / BCRC 22015 / CBS 2517 / CECT 1963 / NBRC 1671 / NRRL Y-8276) TaxID=1071382 RepID=H2ATS6_KAZAF|nr:hypothetical protein KAFR_0D01300 [Kazachstania africana CBS 2517]CCF57776.1 hypothetical protein KAFR_0D01300 [Kazachstania africana CBS 2517]
MKPQSITILLTLFIRYILASRENQVILAPNQDTMSQGQGNSDPSLSNLHFTHDLVCNDVECYPLVFEPTNEWQIIRPGQQIPGGLDVKLNLETGLKEAKLLETEEISTDYEFTAQFNEIKGLLSNGDEQSYDEIESKLDDLLEFAHDYKHGLKIISHEFKFITENLSFNESLPFKLREISARLILSCLRNNPPVLNYINETYPSYVGDIFSELSKQNVLEVQILMKRYLNILLELISENYQFSNFEFGTLSNIYKSTNDKQIKLKLLELISHSLQEEHSVSNLQKRNELIDVKSLAQEFSTHIRDKSIDELHVRKFFNSLFNLKKAYPNDIKVDEQFLNWLAQQSEERKLNLGNQLTERDLEQDSFDQKLIESRHLLFGNPMANRIKHFEDEL